MSNIPTLNWPTGPSDDLDNSLQSNGNLESIESMNHSPPSTTIDSNTSQHNSNTQTTTSSIFSPLPSSTISNQPTYPLFINGPPPLTFALPPPNYQSPSSSGLAQSSVETAFNQTEPSSSLSGKSELSSVLDPKKSTVHLPSLTITTNQRTDPCNPQNDTPIASESTSESHITNGDSSSNITRGKKRPNPSDCSTHGSQKHQCLFSPKSRNNQAQIPSLSDIHSEGSSKESLPSSSCYLEPNQSTTSIDNCSINGRNDNASSTLLHDSRSNFTGDIDNTIDELDSTIHSTPSLLAPPSDGLSLDTPNSGNESTTETLTAPQLNSSGSPSLQNSSRFFPSDHSFPRPNSSLRFPFPSNITRTDQSTDDQTTSSTTVPQSFTSRLPTTLSGPDPPDNTGRDIANAMSGAAALAARRNPNASSVENQASMLAQLLAIAATATAFSLMSEEHSNGNGSVSRGRTDDLANFNSPSAFNMDNTLNTDGNNNGREGSSIPLTSSSAEGSSITSNDDAETRSDNISGTDSPQSSNPLHGGSTTLQAFIQELRSGLLTSQLSRSLQNAAASGSAGENGDTQRPMNYMRVFQLSSNTPRVENGVNMVPVLIVGVRSAQLEDEIEMNEMRASVRSAADVFLRGTSNNTSGRQDNNDAASDPAIRAGSEAGTSVADTINNTNPSHDSTTTTSPITSNNTSVSNLATEEEPPRQTWVVYVFGGTYPENHPILQRPSILTDNPTYEDLLDLGALMGQVRSPVATNEEVSNSGGLFYVGKPNEILEHSFKEDDDSGDDGDEDDANGQNNDKKNSDSTDTSTADEAPKLCVENKDDEAVLKKVVDGSSEANSANITSKPKISDALKNAATTIQGTRCLICLSDFEYAEECRLLKKCLHSFHKHCIDRWLTTGRNSCPLCRSNGVEKMRDKPKHSKNKSDVHSASQSNVSSSV